MGRASNPREALAAALGDAIGKAITAGDRHTARVAYEALGRLIDEPASPPAAVATLRDAGRRGGSGA